MKSLFKKLFGKKKQEEPASNGFAIDVSGAKSGLDDKFLFDFKNYGSMYTNVNPGLVISGTAINFDGDSEGGQPEDDRTPTKIAIKPIDVLDQLETIPTPWTLSNLQDKIDVLKYKSELIVQHYAKREVDALIERLENRKKWEDHKAFFNEFQNTTDEKIDLLLEKYDLVMQTSDLFVPEFPDEAIEVMRAYTEEMQKVCGKKPVFYVIAEPDKFRKAYEKRDPILLVQSPFGFYWQILGAWDKEMILLSEL